MTSDDYLTLDSVEGKPWNPEIVNGAWCMVENARDDLEQASMLNPDTADLFQKLLSALERDEQGFRDANRS